MRKDLVVTGLCAAALLPMASLVGCGSSTASASKVTDAAGATSCDSSGYYLVLKTTGDHETIYDCTFTSGADFKTTKKCVTFENGIADDSTAEVRLVFSTTLGSPKPSCLSG